ncbi:pyrroline-5-carboxylate reductase [archaeon]|nr:MAG: pyrroline-5-carboxylate reductase [archaeon]
MTHPAAISKECKTISMNARTIKLPAFKEFRQQSGSSATAIFFTLFTFALLVEDMMRFPLRPFFRKTAVNGSNWRNLSDDSSLCHRMSFLGGGQMTEAILGALQAKNIQKMDTITVVDTNPDRLTHLRNKFGVSITSDANLGVENADFVVLAVKPQTVTSLAASLKKPPKQLLLSIVAGLTVSDIRKSFNCEHIIRTMPNTPAMVLEGVTVWMANSSMPQALKAQAMTFLQSFGEELEVQDERYIDMATAVSGSGPGYVFLTMEAMIDAAVHLGFPRYMAEKLVISTIRGSAIYALKSGTHSAKLRNSVTSPGGTTASALYAMERGGYRTVVADAIWAAYRRTLELGGQDSNVGPGMR